MPDRQIPLVATQFFRFCCVGLVSTLVNYGVFYALFEFMDVHYIAASALGFIAGALLGFRLNRAWTYRDSAREGQLLPRYMAVYGFSLLLGLGVLHALVEWLGLSPELGNLVTIAVTTMSNFAGTKVWVFRA